MKKIFAYGTITLFGWLFQNHLTNQFFSLYTSPPYCYGNDRFFQPRINFRRLKRFEFMRFRLLPFRSPLLGEYESQFYWCSRLSGLTNKKVNRFFLFLRVLKCFTSPGLLLYHLRIKIWQHYSPWVFPFGHRRIKAR